MEAFSLDPFAREIAGRLFQSRTVVISGPIDQKLAERVTGQLTALAAESDAPITLMLNSQGGHVEAGDTIHDMIQFVGPRVRIVGTGWAASAGALIYVAAPRPDRYCLPNTRFMLHQPLGGVQGQASDVEIEAEEILKMRDRLNRIFAKATGQPLEKIERDTRRNFWLSAQEAVDYGLVGRVIRNVGELD